MSAIIKMAITSSFAITTQKDTTLNGSLIAAQEANNNGQLILKTGTLHVSSLDDTLRTKVDATLDTRLLTADGRAQIKQKNG